MTRQQRPVHVVGVGMIPFTKPGASDPYTVMGARAAKLALDDAGGEVAARAMGTFRYREPA